MPWSRKAHELFLHARAQGCCEAVHAALFRSFFEKQADIGRIDVLVALAEEQGLDASEARAVLDVDRYAAEVEEMREAALRSGVRGPPTLEAGGRRLEGLPDRGSLLRFLEMAGYG
jgi:predicted DsbA family dithiol-disulfide isomerase